MRSLIVFKRMLTPFLYPLVILSLVGFILTTVSGCSRAKPVHEAPVAVPLAWRDSGGISAWSDRWWEAFGSAELNALVGKALADNLEAKQLAARIVQAEASARAARSGLFPTLSAGGSAGHTRSRSAATSAAGLSASRAAFGTEVSTGESFSLNLTAGYEVDLWGRLRASQNSANVNKLAAESDWQAARIVLAGRVTNVWFQILEQRAQAKLLAAQIETLERYVELIELRFTQGLATASDVYAQRQQLQGAQARQPSIDGQAQVLELQLATLLGVPAGTPVAFPGETLPTLPAIPVMDAPGTVLARRPDVRAALLRLESADEGVAAAVADRLPSLSLSAVFSDTQAHASNLFDTWALNLAASLAAPILDGGRRKAEVDRTRAVAEERLAAVGQTLLDAIEEVESAAVRERQQTERLARLDTQLETARNTLAAARQNYLEGVGDYLRVLTSLQSMQALEQQVLTEERLLLSSRVTLYLALGGAWDSPGAGTVPHRRMLDAQNAVAQEDSP